MSYAQSIELIPKTDNELFTGLENDATGIKIEVMPGAEGLFNVAVWNMLADVEDLEDTISYKEPIVCLLGRGAVMSSGIGKPDVTPLVYRTLDPDGKVRSSETVFVPKDGENSLEDARVLRLADGRLIIGLTSVAKIDEDYVPYPAIVITSGNQLATGLREHKIVANLGIGEQTIGLSENIAGKNTTIINETTVMFRPEGAECNHRLRVFGFNDGMASVLQDDIELPDNIPWATFRTGTTIPPVWINDHEAIFPIHGIRKDKDGKFVYSIGAARLNSDGNGALSIDNISQEPLIHPDLFAGMIGAEDVELHSERRVVYCCGGRPVFDSSGKFQELEMLINVGDTHTFKVTIPKVKLTEGWQDDQKVVLVHQLTQAA